MAQTSNFFYNPSFVDFIPGSPQVDLQFLKSVADDYKAAVDKQDAVKDQLLSGLASLDLHQTFSKDYASMMENVDSQLEQLDNKYSGKLIDRNYGNELKGLIRNVQNDPNLRYMLNTTKELRTYEQQLRESKDYLDFNDPNRSAYQNVLNRAKGTQPLFTAGTIYADSKPDKELFEVASKIGITAETKFEYVVDENGMGTGVVYTINEQTRTREDVTGKMKPYMETFRNTLGGQQLQREAASRGMSYEQLYVEKISALGPLLEEKKIQSTIGLDPAWQAQMERTKLMVQQQEADENRRFQATENARNRQHAETLQEKQLKAQERMADRGHILQLMNLEQQWTQMGLNLDLQYDQLNSALDRADAQTALELMKAQLEVMKNYYDPTRNGRGGGSGGAGSSGSGTSTDPKLTLDYSLSQRFSGTFPHIEDPKSVDFRQKQKQLKDFESNIIFMADEIDKKYKPNSMGNYVTALVMQLENAGTSKERQNILKSVVIAGGKSQTLQQILNNDKDVLEFRNVYAQSLLLHKDIASAEAKGAQAVYDHVSNGNDYQKLIQSGAMKVERAGGGLAERVVIDEQKLMNYYGATTFADDQRNKPFRVLLRAEGVGLYKPNQLQNTETRWGGVLLDSAGIYNAYSERKAYTSPDGYKLSAEDVIKLVKERQEKVYEAIKVNFPVVGGYLEAKNNAFTSLTSSQDVKGYGFNPEGTDKYAEIDKNYAAFLQTNISNLNLTTTNGQSLKWDKDGFVVPKSSYSQGITAATHFKHITPVGAFIDRYGDITVTARLYEGKDENGYTGPSVSVVFKDNDDNINGTLLKPLFLNEYESESIADFLASRVHDNAKWIASSFRSQSIKGDLTKNFDDGVDVTKNVGGTYTVAFGGTTRSVSSEFELATLLSLIEYNTTTASAGGLPGMPEFDMPDLSTPRYGPRETKFKTYDDLMKEFNELNAGLDDPKVYTLNEETNTTRDTKAITNQTMDYIFNGPVSGVESGGNYGAVNDDLQKDGRRPTWAAGKYQFLPSKWDTFINDRAREYYGDKKGANYHIYDKRADQLEGYDIRGDNYNEFLKDAGFQEYVMKKAVNDVYIPAYSRLDPKIREKISPSDYFIVAHYAGIGDAEKYFTDRVTGSRTLKTGKEANTTAYLNKVKGTGDGLGLVDYSQGMSMITEYDMKIDYKLRNLPPGSSLILADGSKYEKTSPKGVPNYKHTPVDGVPKSGIKPTPSLPTKPSTGAVPPPNTGSPSLGTPKTSTPAKEATSSSSSNSGINSSSSTNLIDYTIDVIADKSKAYGINLPQSIINSTKDFIRRETQNAESVLTKDEISIYVDDQFNKYAKSINKTLPKVDATITDIGKQTISVLKTLEKQIKDYEPFINNNKNNPGAIESWLKREIGADNVQAVLDNPIQFIIDVAYAQRGANYTSTDDYYSAKQAINILDKLGLLNTSTAQVVKDTNDLLQYVLKELSTLK